MSDVLQSHPMGFSYSKPRPHAMSQLSIEGNVAHSRLCPALSHLALEMRTRHQFPLGGLLAVYKLRANPDLLGHRLYSNRIHK